MSKRRYSPGPDSDSEDDYYGQDLDISDTRNIPERTLTDYFCKMCDSHMNSGQMWAQHVSGKRHLKNLKKKPGEQPSKIKAVPCNLVPKIQDEIEAIKVPVVGLDHICETRRADPDIDPLYNCRLCQGTFSIVDIIDHLVSSKHRWNYLRKESKDFGTLDKLKLSNDQRESIVLEKVAKLESDFGRGTMEVKIEKVHGIIPRPYSPLVRKMPRLDADYLPYAECSQSSHQSSRSSRPPSRLAVPASKPASAAKLASVPASKLAPASSKSSPSPRPSTSHASSSSSTSVSAPPLPPKPVKREKIDYVKHADKLTGEQWTEVTKLFEEEALANPDSLDNDKTKEDILYQCLRIGLSTNLAYYYNKSSESQREKFLAEIDYEAKEKADFAEMQRFSW